MLDWLTDPFTSPIVQRALAEVLILSLACGPLGVWVLLYRDAYAAESISHGMLPGLVIAALAGIPLLLGATAGVLLAAAGIALVARDPRLSSDVGVAVCVSALFGLGGMLALSPATPPRLAELLFGDLLGVSGGDLVVAAVLAGGVALALAAGYRSLALVGFDRDAAPSLGARPARWELGLLVVLAVTTVAAVQGLGNLLLLALVLAPAAAALSLAAPAARRARAVGCARGAGRDRGPGALLPPGDRGGRLGRAVRGGGRGPRAARAWPFLRLTGRRACATIAPPMAERTSYEVAHESPAGALTCRAATASCSARRSCAGRAGSSRWAVPRSCSPSAEWWRRWCCPAATTARPRRPRPLRRHGRRRARRRP